MLSGFTYTVWQFVVFLALLYGYSKHVANVQYTMKHVANVQYTMKHVVYLCVCWLYYIGFSVRFIKNLLFEHKKDKIMK